MESFGEISWSEFPHNYIKTIRKEILSKGKEYILKVDDKKVFCKRSGIISFELDWEEEK